MRSVSSLSSVLHLSGVHLAGVGPAVTRLAGGADRSVAHATGFGAQHAFPYLTMLILAPVITAAIVLLTPGSMRIVIRAIAMTGALVVVGIAIAMISVFHAGDGGYQMVSSHQWAPGLGISWTLGVDGISLFLVALTALLFPLVLAVRSPLHNVKAFSVWMLLLEAGCIGSFVSLDLLMFFLFFETTLVPVYFVMIGWGHDGRSPAAIKFFIYTFTGSALLLVGSIALAFLHQSQTGVLTFDIRTLAATHLTGTQGVLLFLAFTFAFAVKAPIWPLHTWSPDAYAEAPASGSIILAGVMAKIGTYGIVRFDLNLFPHATVMLAPLLLTLGLIGILYGGMVAARQRNLKRLVAFSSLSHMGFIVLGTFALTGQAVTGAVIQMVNHGLYTAALFFLIAMIFQRYRSFDVRDFGGLQTRAPVLAAMFTIVMLASIGIPGLNGFIGEFLILAGSFAAHRWWSVVAVFGVVISTVYLLWAYQQVFHGKTSATVEERGFPDLGVRERLVLVPLIALIVFLGVYPKPVLDRIEPAVNQLIAHVHQVTTASSPLRGSSALSSTAGK